MQMQSITLTADVESISLGRFEAQQRGSSLNALFREWLNDLAGRDARRKKISRLLKQMDNFDAGGNFSREEMNER